MLSLALFGRGATVTKELRRAREFKAQVLGAACCALLADWMPYDEPSLPLCDEAGRFLPGVSALPAKRLAGRMWHLASQRTAGAPESLRVLLEQAERHGVTWSHPSASNGSGATPLHIACILGNRTAVAHLLDYRGAYATDFIDRCDNFGTTALMAAACRGREGCVSMLLKAHADPNIKNYRGYTGARTLTTWTAPS